MPRSVLPEYAVFHATARGAGRIAIYREDDDRRFFLALLADSVSRFGWSFHAFCLMRLLAKWWKGIWGPRCRPRAVFRAASPPRGKGAPEG